MSNRNHGRGVWRMFSVSALAAAALLMVGAKPLPLADAPPAGEITLKGEYKWGNRTGPITAKLTPAGDKTYTVAYSVTFGGKPSSWTGTMKGDLDGELSGDGSSRSGKWEFSGKFDGGTAKCNYKEVNGRRNGTLTWTK